MSEGKRVACLLTLAGLVVRLIGLGQHSFWFDEGLEINRACTPWPDLILLSEGPDPPVYRLLLAPFTPFAPSEFVLRLPSAVLGAATVYLLYRWLALLKQPRLGIIAAALMTIAPVSIYYSQEVSQYSLVVFLSIALLIAFEKAALTGTGRDWLQLWLVSMAALYTHYGLVYVFSVLELNLAWQTWRRRSKQRLIGFAGYHVGLLIGLALLYHFFIVTQYDRIKERVSLQPRFAQMGWLDIIRAFDDNLFDVFLRFQTIPYSEAAPSLIPAFLGLLALLGAVVICWRLPKVRRLVLVPAVILIAFYIASGLGYYRFGMRYGLPLLPFLLLFIAATIWELARRWQLGASVVAGLVVATFLAFWPNMRLLPNPWLNLPREELRPVVAYVHQQAQPGDFIYVYYGAVPAYQVYQPELTYPTELGTWFRDWPLVEKLSEICQAVGDAPRFWLVMSHIHPSEDPALIDGLTEATPSYHLVDEYRTKNAATVLLQRDEP